MSKQTIIISAYPKSGSSWLTRLLADTLNCPSAGSHPSQDKREIASEGWDRSGDYIVRKGHYRLAFYNVATEFLHKPHLLSLYHKTNERIIFLIRDPRDIIVSACHHWKKRSREEVIKLVCHGGLANMPSWDEYIKQWRQIENVIWTSYKFLHIMPEAEVRYVLKGLGYDTTRVLPAIERQSFDTRKKQIEKEGQSLYLGKEYNLRFMRKGIVGDYKNFLTDKEQGYVWDKLGDVMMEMGYER